MEPIQKTRMHERIDKFAKYVDEKTDSSYLAISVVVLTSPIWVPTFVAYHCIYGGKNERIRQRDQVVIEENHKRDFDPKTVLNTYGGNRIIIPRYHNLETVRFKSKYEVESVDFYGSNSTVPFYSYNAKGKKDIEFDFIKEPYLKLDLIYCEQIYMIIIPVEKKNYCVTGFVECKFSYIEIDYANNYGRWNYEYVTILFSDGQRAVLETGYHGVIRKEKPGEMYYPTLLSDKYIKDKQLEKDRKKTLLLCMLRKKKSCNDVDKHFLKFL